MEWAHSKPEALTVAVDDVEQVQPKQRRGSASARRMKRVSVCISSGIYGVDDLRHLFR